jgi:L-threonylcarbamoyladenylate synthase
MRIRALQAFERYHRFITTQKRFINTMAASTDGTIRDRAQLSSLPYAGCNTRIVALQDVGIPEHATEEEYRAIYTRYIQQASVQDPTSNPALLRDAIESVQYGIAPPVAFPTETVYGLGADATNEASTSGIFAAKGRPSDNPLIVHVASVSQLERLSGLPLPDIYRPVTAKFWPGPLTILLPVPQSGVFAKNVHPAQRTIGFRIPSSKYARFFIAATDKPIAGPSANSSGKPSPTTARHVLEDLKGRINFILDGGSCDVGVESTVIDGLHDPPLILRPGGVGLEEFRALGRSLGGDIGKRWAETTIGYKAHHLVGKPPSDTNENNLTGPHDGSDVIETNGTKSSYDEDDNGAPRAPGMKYRHYAPQGRLVLFSEEAVRAGRVTERLTLLTNTEGQHNPDGLRIGIISCQWPPFAGTNDASEFKVVAQQDSKPKLPTDSVYAQVTTTTVLRRGSMDITLYNVHLGPEISALAHSLFGVLRLFDELNCDHIFAETVRRSSPAQDCVQDGVSSPPFNCGGVNGEGSCNAGAGKTTSRQVQLDLEDAVIDRIEKAAAERIDW